MLWSKASGQGFCAANQGGEGSGVPERRACLPRSIAQARHVEPSLPEREEAPQRGPRRGGPAPLQAGGEGPGCVHTQASASPTNTTAFFPMGGPKRPLRRRSSLDMMMSWV